MNLVTLTVSGALAPWLIVVVITVVGAATGVIIVQRVVPDVLAAARDSQGQAGATAAVGTGASTDGNEAAFVESTPVESQRADTPVEPIRIPDAEAGTAGGDTAGPHRFSIDDSANVVGRMQVIEPVDPTPKPVPVDVDSGVSAVTPTGDDTERIGPVERPSEPATMTTTGLVEVVTEATLIEAVETAETTEPADEADGDTEIVCDYCGRDDFETVPQRNGHLRWCEEYDPNAAAEGSAETGIAADVTDPVEEEREEVDAIAMYAAVRRQLQAELDISNRRTSREFYHVCRSRGLDGERLAALERLTQAYETVQYSDNPDLDADEIRAAAARFETVEL